MSMAYHLETDGSSERTNKTINQCIRYHVKRNQKGWVRALPRVRFHMMSAVNASTGFSLFELKMGQSPRVLPPLQKEEQPKDLDEEAMQNLIAQINNDVAEAKDCLWLAKAEQAYQANKSRALDDVYEVGDKVMLSTLNRRREYKKKNEKRTAKFFP
jgi:hypothetical protein